MKVLIGCEESQTITIAFRKIGHEAFSCDLKPCSGGHPEWHLQMDVFAAIECIKPNLVILHPPCTRLANSGVLRLYKDGKKANGIDPHKWSDMVAGANFFKRCLQVDVPMVVVENPIPHGHAMKIIGQRYAQIIQPYDFGDDASKATCLWIKGLPLLKATGYCKPRYVDGKPRWGNQTDGGQNKLPPDKKGEAGKRAELRSKTYPGIAAAMAEQWGGPARIVDLFSK